MSRWQDSLVGWKIGYISADRRTAGDPDLLVGPIWRQQCHLSEEQVSAAEVDIFASGFAAVEAELVIRLGQDLPAHDGGGWTAEEAADLEQHLLVGVEVASSPIPDINSLGPTVIAADFGNNNGLVLGSSLRTGLVELRSNLPVTSTGSSWEEDLPRTCPGGFIMVWRLP
jgi:2-keto-4-pentenoate hydratase